MIGAWIRKYKVIEVRALPLLAAFQPLRQS